MIGLNCYCTAQTNDKTRQDKTRQDQTRPDKTRQDQTRPDKTRQDQTRPDKTRQDQTRPDKTRQDQTRPDQTTQDKTRQDQTRPDKTRQDQTKPDKTRQDQTRPDKTIPWRQYNADKTLQTTPLLKIIMCAWVLILVPLWRVQGQYWGDILKNWCLLKSQHQIESIWFPEHEHWCRL
jgi:hypothetical protein